MIEREEIERRYGAIRGAMAQSGLKEMRFSIDFEGSKVLVNF